MIKKSESEPVVEKIHFAPKAAEHKPVKAAKPAAPPEVKDPDWHLSPKEKFEAFQEKILKVSGGDVEKAPDGSTKPSEEVLVTLASPFWLNGTQYGPGPTMVPADAYSVWQGCVEHPAGPKL